MSVSTTIMSNNSWEISSHCANELRIGNIVYRLNRYSHNNWCVNFLARFNYLVNIGNIQVCDNFLGEY